MFRPSRDANSLRMRTEANPLASSESFTRKSTSLSGRSSLRAHEPKTQSFSALCRLAMAYISSRFARISSSMHIWLDAPNQFPNYALPPALARRRTYYIKSPLRIARAARRFLRALRARQNPFSLEPQKPHNCSKRILAENPKLAVIESPRRRRPAEEPVGRRLLP